MKTHYSGTFKSGHILYCSGRHAMYAMVSARLDEITCGACRRRLIAKSRKAA